MFHAHVVAILRRYTTHDVPKLPVTSRIDIANAFCCLATVASQYISLQYSYPLPWIANRSVHLQEAFTINQD